ncbi:glutaredoxin family protein [Halovenus rubra]|uniref:Glutaredoxin family protein n=2 Tax=Halovenus rubra TaxID=869890 RepID=A0ABD5X774_9EURY|nr:glutaredoxin [Halovenus rubra]
MRTLDSFEIRSDNIDKLVTDVDEIERPLLYDREDCVYSTRVRVALENNSVDYDEIWAPEDTDDRDIVEEITGQRTVPVMLDPAADRDYFTDTETMLAHIEETYS